MKKVLSLVLAFVLVLGAVPTAFAFEDKGSAGENLKAYEFITGGTGGNLMENEQFTREQLAKVLAELNGKAAEAAKFEGALKFKDASKVGAWAVPYVAFAVEQGWLKGNDKNEYNPKGIVSGQELLSAMLNVLGYQVEWSKVVEEAKTVGFVAAEGNLNRGQAFETLWKVVSSVPKKGASKPLGVELGKLDAGVAGALAVKGIKADSATTFAVSFNKAVTDADKITFEVTRGTSKVSVTATYSEDKMTATLKGASAYAMGEYNVQVLADAKEMAKEVIKIEAQKLAKIEITSTVLSVSNQTVGGVTTQKGYATYKAYDQYGQDVTSSYLAQNIEFMTGAGPITKKDGILTITPTGAVNLIAMPTIAISGFDRNSAVSVTANLTPAVAMGTLKEFELKPVDPINITAGDTTTVVYVPFKALDMSGNEVKNYEFIKDGLLLNGTNNDEITVTNNWVKGFLVQDPKNPLNAAIKIVAQSTTPGNFNMDLPFNVTAMTKTGKVSTVTGTLKPVAQIDSITFFAPTTVVAQGEFAVIPFEAVDKAGKKLTKTAEINPDQTLNLSGLTAHTKVDGSMYLMSTTTLNAEGPQMFSGSVKNTGKFTNVTVMVQKAAVADSMTLSIANRAKEVGRPTDVGFGYKAQYTGIEVKDQYGRNMNMIRGGFANTYKVEVLQEAGNNTFSVSNIGGANLSTGAAVTLAAGSTTLANNGIVVKAENKGSETLTFVLKTNAGVEIVRRAHTFTAVDTADIVSYTVAPWYPEVYTGGTPAAGNNWQVGFTTRGKTISGTLVDIVGANVSVQPVNVADFGSYADPSYKATIFANGTSASYAAKVSETDLNVTVIHGSNIQMINTKLKSSTVKPFAKDITFDITDDEAINATRSLSNDVLTLAAASYANVAALSGNGFYVEDNYDAWGMYGNLTPVAYRVSSYKTAAGVAMASRVTVANDGTFTWATAPVAGESFLLTAITSNGLVKTIKVQF